MPEGRRDEFAAVPLLAGPDAVTDRARFDAALREAIRAEHKVAIAYRDREDDLTDRMIWPFAVGYFRSARVVAAWCELRADYRHFRLDRIDALTPTATRYPRRRHALFEEWREREGVELTETRTPAARNRHTPGHLRAVHATETPRCPAPTSFSSMSPAPPPAPPSTLTCSAARRSRRHRSFAMFALDGGMMLGLWALPATPAAMELAFTVDDVDATCADWTARGITILAPRPTWSSAGPSWPRIPMGICCGC
jgi:hypothetical protein